MKRAGKISASATALMMMAGSAVAADVQVVVAPVAPPPPEPAVTFSWDRFYVGAYGGISRFGTGPQSLDGDELLGGVWFGRNVQVGGNLVFGVDVMVGAIEETGFNAYILGRAGLLLGSRLLIYGALGVGIVPPHLADWPTAAAGIELGLGDSLSVRGQIMWFGLNNYPFMDVTVQGGLTWHIGR